jgi:hypothetical protein
MVAVLESPPEFAAKKTGAKKSQKCNPGKSHACVRVDGTMYCISLSRKCRMPATGAAKQAADYIKEKGGALATTPKSAVSTTAKPSQPSTSSATKNPIDALDDKYASANPTRADVDNWIKSRLEIEADAEQLAMPTALMRIGSGYTRMTAAMPDVPEYVKSITGKESWAQAKVISEEALHSKREAWKPEDFVMLDRAGLEKKLKSAKTSDKRKAEIKRELEDSDKSSKEAADRMNKLREEVLSNPAARLEAARSEFTQIASGYEASSKDLKQKLASGDPATQAKLSDNLLRSLPVYSTVLSQTGMTPEAGTALYRRTVREHLKNLATATPERQLKVQGDVTPESVKAAYKVAARKAHPDTGGSKEEFEAVNSAYKKLKERLNFSDEDDFEIFQIQTSTEMPLSFAEIEIEILPKGTHTSNSGYQLQATDRELDELVETYNPTNFQAPLIITHDTKGVGDGILANSEFSYGVPKALKRVGDTVKAVFDKVAPEFENWVRDRKLLTVSPSFYLANSPGNPTPGKLALRHIAALGATPPAIKSLAPLSTAFNFGEGDEGVISLDFDAGAIDFDCGCGGGDGYITSGLWQRLRDWLIDQYGLETADKIIPGYEVGILTERRLDNPLMERLHELEEKVFGQEQSEEYSEMTANKTTETTDAVDFSEKEQEIAARELKIAAREQAIAVQEATLRTQQFTSFCENDLKDRLTPAMASTTEVVAFMEFLHSPASVDFSAGEAASPLDWFKSFLNKLPTAVEFGEMAKDALVDPVSLPKGTWDAAEVEKEASIQRWCKGNGKNPEVFADRSAAMLALGIFF